MKDMRLRNIPSLLILFLKEPEILRLVKKVTPKDEVEKKHGVS